MTRQHSIASILFPLQLVLLMWCSFFIGGWLKVDFGFLGIEPRTLIGLIGIFMAPLIHGNFSHLISNAIPVLFLGSSLYFFYPIGAKWMFAQCYLLTNILVWFFGRPFSHIGASGLVYSLAFLLIFIGIFDRQFKTILFSAIILFSYGGLLYSAFDINQAVSWESHLFGALVGITVAFVSSNLRRST